MEVDCHFLCMTVSRKQCCPVRALTVKIQIASGYGKNVEQGKYIFFFHRIVARLLFYMQSVEDNRQTYTVGNKKVGTAFHRLVTEQTGVLFFRVAKQDTQSLLSKVWSSSPFLLENSETKTLDSKEICPVSMTIVLIQWVLEPNYKDRLFSSILVQVKLSGDKWKRQEISDRATLPTNEYSKELLNSVLLVSILKHRTWFYLSFFQAQVLLTAVCR